MPMDRSRGVRGVSVMGVRGVPIGRPWAVHGSPVGCPWVRGLSVDRPTVAYGSLVGCPWEAYGLLMKCAKQNLHQVQKSNNVNTSNSSMGIP